jgi:hypothetical protein
MAASSNGRGADNSMYALGLLMNNVGFWSDGRAHAAAGIIAAARERELTGQHVSMPCDSDALYRPVVYLAPHRPAARPDPVVCAARAAPLTTPGSFEGTAPQLAAWARDGLIFTDSLGFAVLARYFWWCDLRPAELTPHCRQFVYNANAAVPLRYDPASRAAGS